jgi:hypothetical protein
MVTRREVLQGAAVAAASSAIGSGAELAAEPGWFDEPMRWAQLNSTEDDAAEMDIPFWLDYFQRIHADALCITAGGVVAFYPSKIKYHRMSQWPERRPDYLRTVVEGCRKLGLAMVARTDPHASYERRVSRSSGLDRGGCRGPQTAALGNAGHVGDLRAWALQLRVHDRGHQRDRRHFSRDGRRLQQSMGRLG